MMKTLAHNPLLLALIALPALLTAQSVAAQSWTVGEVAPTWSNTTPWTPPIDPDDPHPADAFEPAAIDENGYTRSDWITSDHQRTQVALPNGDGKFRTNCRPTFIKRADPLLFPGQYPIGHGHTFFGPTDPYIAENAENFDYAMGRNHPGSSCQGGPLNTTLYWEPSIYDSRYGPILTVIPEIATFYYTHHGTDAAETTRLRRNFRFIGGANPADYNDAERRAEYALAGLEYPGSPDTPAGFHGVQCLVGSSNITVLEEHAMKSPAGFLNTSAARYLKGPAGEDPWDGNCTAGSIIVQVNAPDCWDGTNLSSPDGRDHVRYSSRDEDNDPAGQCPDEYVKVLHFETKIEVPHNGWDQDLQFWYMSSDRMNPPSTPADPTSLDPCRQIGPYFCAFSTAHFDWWGSWDNVEVERWQRNCGGLTIGGISADYADCGSGGTDNNRSLRAGGPSPDPSLSTDPVASLANTPRASSSVAGQRYFPVNPDDQVQPGLQLDVQPAHHGS